MLSHSDNNKADVIETFTSTSRYLNTNKPYCEQMVSQIYPTELQSNKAKSLILFYYFCLSFRSFMHFVVYFVLPKHQKGPAHSPHLKYFVIIFRQSCLEV